MKLINWGILSTGRIAGVFAQGVARSKTGRLWAVGSRSLESSQRFAHDHRIPRAYGSYEELLADPSVDVVYIGTPHPLHAHWAVKAAKAGKGILCEKPMAMNLPDARKMVKAARENKVFFMEGFMYRCHPQTAKLVELIRKKTIGEVRVIHASFCFETAVDLKNRLFNRKLGGGGILDVGCYPVSMARLVAGAALGFAPGRVFADPLEVKGSAILGAKSQVDEVAVATLKFPGGILAELSCGIRANRNGPMVKIDGLKGSVMVPSPWSARRYGGTSYLLLQMHGEKKPRKIPVRYNRSIYTFEADTVAGCLRKGRKESPAMGWNDSLGNMKILDLWRKSAGVYY